MRKWIKLDKSWQRVAGEAMERDFDNCSRDFQLPVAREFPDRGLMKTTHPQFVVEGGWMINQFHNVGVKLCGGDPHSLQFAQTQLQSLLTERYIVEGDEHDSET